MGWDREKERNAGTPCDRVASQLQSLMLLGVVHLADGQVRSPGRRGCLADVACLLWGRGSGWGGGLWLVGRVSAGQASLVQRISLQAMGRPLSWAAAVSLNG